MLQGPPGAAGPELEAAAARMGVVLPAALRQRAEVHVWQENWPAVRIFRAMQTQLRVSFGGVEGFDYGALPVVERRLGIGRADANDAFWALQLMEAELITWHNRPAGG